MKTGILHLVKSFLEIHIVPGIDKHYRSSDGVFQIHAKPQVIDYRLQERKGINASKQEFGSRQTSMQTEFSWVTKDTAAGIKLPPDPPITRIPPDCDSNTTGVIEEGGCSPATITLPVRHFGCIVVLCLLFNVCDFTRPHCVGPPAEIRQLVVEDDACSRGVNGSSESTAQIRRRHYDLIEYRPIITDCLKGCPAHRWFMVLVAETARPSSSMTETCVVPMWSGPGTVL